MEFIKDTTIISLYSGPDELTLQVTDRSLNRIYRKTMNINDEELGLFRYVGGMSSAIKHLSNTLDKWQKSQSLDSVTLLYKDKSCQLRFKLTVFEEASTQIDICLPQQRVQASNVKTQSAITQLQHDMEGLKSTLGLNSNRSLSIFSKLANRFSLIGRDLIPLDAQSIHIINAKNGNLRISGNKVASNLCSDRSVALPTTHKFDVHNLLNCKDDVQQVLDDLDSLSSLKHLFIGGFYMDSKMQLPNLQKLETLSVVHCGLDGLGSIPRSVNMLVLSGSFFKTPPNLKSLSKLTKLEIRKCNVDDPHLSGVEVVKS